MSFYSHSLATIMISIHIPWLLLNLHMDAAMLDPQGVPYLPYFTVGFFFHCPSPPTWLLDYNRLFITHNTRQHIRHRNRSQYHLSLCLMWINLICLLLMWLKLTSFKNFHPYKARKMYLKTYYAISSLGIKSKFDGKTQYLNENCRLCQDI